jgi:hypothetical protein
MQQSNAEQPDLDWSQVRETIKLLTISATQLEGSMRVGDESVTTLTASFTKMVEHLAAISAQLEIIDDCEASSIAKMHCAQTSELVHSSIIAFQFYDRMQQCLQHVTLSLNGLSEIVDNPQKLYNPQEWKNLQNHIRTQYTMESEKMMFDAILQGKSVEEALQLVAMQQTEPKEDDIELF